MTNAFKPLGEPEDGLTELAAIVDILPPHGEFTGPIYKQPAPSAAEYTIRDIVREAAQRLEHAGLVIPKQYESYGCRSSGGTYMGWGMTPRA
jgi:hypothetical protein